MKIYRYSEAFKQQVISDIESGRFRSANEAKEAYGIGGTRTVHNWIRAYGRGELLKKVVRVEKPGEPSELKRMKERIRDLESALSDAYIEKLLAESGLEILCERTNTDIEAFKKKHVGKELSERKRRAKREKG